MNLPTKGAAKRLILSLLAVSCLAGCAGYGPSQASNDPSYDDGSPSAMRDFDDWGPRHGGRHGGPHFRGGGGHARQ